MPSMVIWAKIPQNQKILTLFNFIIKNIKFCFSTSTRQMNRTNLKTTKIYNFLKTLQAPYIENLNFAWYTFQRMGLLGLQNIKNHMFQDQFLNKSQNKLNRKSKILSGRCNYSVNLNNNFQKNSKLEETQETSKKNHCT